MPGTVSANSRKLRVTCGTVLMVFSETLVPTSEVLTSCRATPTAVTASSVVTPSAGAAPRSRLTEVATASVTVFSVPGPASTL
jgi:hypothetical protein